MSNYKSLIDEAMRTATYRLNSGVDKTASAPEDSSIVKEASELANALEYMSMQTANDGSLVGQARAEMIRDFHKAASAQRLGVKLAGTVGEGPTQSSGVQAHAPEHGKTRLMPKKEVSGNPMVTSSPDSTGKTMLESYKQANSGSTLYDILMHQKEAQRPAMTEDEINRVKNTALVSNIVPVPLVGGGSIGAALSAPDGRKLDAGLGALGGSMVGGLGGGIAGGLTGGALGALGGANLAQAGAAIGGGLGTLGGALYGQRRGIDHMLRKEAGDVGEMDASMPAPGIPSSNENSNRRILNDANVLNGVSKQEAKAPVRDRLSEAFASTSDTLGDQTVRSLFPQAYQRGGLKKTAMTEEELQRSTMLAALPGYFGVGGSAAGAGQGNRLRSALGTFGGKVVGGALGGSGGNLGAALLGDMAGGAAGNYLINQGQVKRASVAERLYSMYTEE